MLPGLPVASEICVLHVRPSEQRFSRFGPAPLTGGENSLECWRPSYTQSGPSLARRSRMSDMDNQLESPLAREQLRKQADGLLEPAKMVAVGL